MSHPEPKVAIDGPAGAGKSTVSRLVAERMGYLLLDTGALYRGIALAARQAGCSWDDDGAVGALARRIAERGGLRFETQKGGPPVLLLDGEDVSVAIRTEDIAQGASRVSALGGVRSALLDLQRRAAEGGGVVLEGRDIGTVVLPDAEAKFFLTASVEVRAARRLKELLSRGETRTLEEVARDVRERDLRDSTREVAPLRQAPDAILVESSDMTIDEVVRTVVSRVRSVREGLAAGTRA